MASLNEKKVICPYCNEQAEFRDSIIIYKKSYGMVWICKNFPDCDSYVGVHKGTTKFYGRMANKQLRFWKKKAHAEFDPVWKYGPLNRGEGYKMAADMMGMEEFHIGELDLDQCVEFILNLLKYKKENNINV